jgi:hypothetical protein
MALTEKLTLVTESSRTAHEELMFRIRHRDDWLKLQLLAQAVLAALAFGIEISGVKGHDPAPWVLDFAAPVSVVFTILYCVEDRLVGLLTRWRGHLYHSEAKRDERLTGIENFEGSPALPEYAKSALWWRLWAQIGAFLVIPGVLGFRREGGWSVPQGLLFIVCIVVPALMLKQSFEYRRRQIKKTEEECGPDNDIG